MTSVVEFENIKFTVHDLGITQLLSRTAMDVYDEGKEDWVLLKDLYIWSHRLQQVIKVPKWFITDLASIPKLARLFLSVNDKHRYAAIIHDWLYRNNAINVTRRQADLIMLDIVRISGVPYWKRACIHIALRIGGWTSFRKTKTFHLVPYPYRCKYEMEHYAVKQ